MIEEIIDSVKSREPANLLAFYQKFFVFEEPHRKWSHINRTASQNGYVDYLDRKKNVDIGQDESKNIISSRLVNVLLAYKEASLFQYGVLQKLKDLHLEKYLPENRVNYWQRIANIDRYLAQWLTLAEIYWPTADEILGLKAEDQRLQFLQYCWQTFENVKAETVKKETVKADWHHSIKLFEQCLSLYRSNLPADFLPCAIILVEGLTEQILLPFFAAGCDLDLVSKGVMIAPAGGANKIVRKYIYWKEIVKLPIFCLFDADALNLANSMQSELRQSDDIYILSDGEIEDLMRLDFLIDKVNDYLAQDPLFDRNKSISFDDFASTEKRTNILNKIWRERGLGKFEKVRFARFVVSQCSRIDSKIKERFLSYGGKDMLNKLARSIARSIDDMTNR